MTLRMMIVGNDIENDDETDPGPPCELVHHCTWED